jgi:hypothetical protein
MLAPMSPTRSLKVLPQFPSAQWLLYLAPQQFELQDFLPVYEASSTLMPCLQFNSSSAASLLSSSPRSAHLDLPFVFVITAVLFSSLTISKTISTLTCKSWAKNKDINSNDWNRDNTTMPGNAFDIAQLFQLVQYMPHAACLVFDPGGLVLVLHEDACERMWKTHTTARPLLSTLAPHLPHFILGYYFPVFSARTHDFFSSCS